MSIPKDPRDTPEPIKEPPVPGPEPEKKVDAESEATPSKTRLEPTRYGDWELNGKCVDF